MSLPLLLLLLGGTLALGLLALLALDFVMTSTMAHGSDQISKAVTVSTDSDDKVYSEFTVAAATTVNYTGCAGLPAAIKAIGINATVAMTLTINYASGADDTFTLVANEPLIWHNKSHLADPFVNTNAITSMDFQNAGVASGTVKIMIARDGTT